MAQPKQMLQLRITPELYAALAADVEKRKHRGETASLTSVAIEYIERGRQATGAKKGVWKR